MRISNPKVKETFAYKYFGKPYNFLTPLEKKEYYRLRKAAERKNNPEKRIRENEYAKEYFAKNKDKIRELQRNWVNRNRDKINKKNKEIRKLKGIRPQEESLPRKMFGKRITELDINEFREYVRVKGLLRRTKMTYEEYLEGNMQYILMSIKKKYLDLIFSGDKKLEIRKTMPVNNLPVKVLFYETLGNYNEISGKYEGSGKIIGECVVNKIEIFPYEHNCDPFNLMKQLDEKVYWIKCGELKDTCLTYEELAEYGKERTVYGWNVTNELCKYQTPIELSDLGLKRPPQSWQYLTKNSLKKHNII